LEPDIGRAKEIKKDNKLAINKMLMT